MAVDTQISAKGSRGHHTFYLKVTETGYDIATNTSTISFDFWLVDDNNWYWSTQGTNVSYKVEIGSSYWAGYIPHHTEKTTDVRSESGLTFTHNSDGTLTLPIKFTVTDSSSISFLPGNASASGSLVCTTIPRTSDISFNNHTIASTSGSLGFTVTSKADFWHRYRYTINGSTSSWINIGEVNNTSWVEYIANTTLLSAMPTSATATITIELATLTANYATYIGSKSASATITITMRPSAPTLTATAFGSRSEGVDSSITLPTAGYTTIALSRWSNGYSYGATSYRTYFTVNQGATLRTSSATTDNTVIETNTLPSWHNAYTITFYAYTIDSRGLKSDTSSIGATVYGYSTPLLTLNAYRTATNASTDTAEDGGGAYAYVTFGNTLRGMTDANGNLISGNQNAILSASCVYGSTAVSNGQHIALAETSTLTFTYTVKDKFTTTKVIKTVPQAKFAMDLYDSGTGVVGAGFGTIAKAGQANFGLPIASEQGVFQAILCDITGTDIMAVDSSITTSSGDDAWFNALLKAICVKYPNRKNTLFIGSINPNSSRYYSVLIYDTSVVSSTTGLPQYSFGMRHALLSTTNQLRFFGTFSYTFQWEALDAANYATNATYANYITTRLFYMTTITDSSINELNASTFTAWLNAHNSSFVAQGTTLAVADARYEGYATVFVNKVTDNYGRAFVLSFYSGLLVAELNNGTWNYIGEVSTIPQSETEWKQSFYINSSFTKSFALGNYGGGIIRGFCQGIGGVLIGFVKTGGTIYAKDLYSQQNWGNSYLTLTLSGNTLVIATPNTSSNSHFTFEYTGY